MMTPYTNAGGGERIYTHGNGEMTNTCEKRLGKMIYPDVWGKEAASSTSGCNLGCASTKSLIKSISLSLSKVAILCTVSDFSQSFRMLYYQVVYPAETVSQLLSASFW